MRFVPESTVILWRVYGFLIDAIRSISYLDFKGRFKLLVHVKEVI